MSSWIRGSAAVRRGRRGSAERGFHGRALRGGLVCLASPLSKYAHFLETCVLGADDWGCRGG